MCNEIDIIWWGRWGHRCGRGEYKLTGDRWERIEIKGCKRWGVWYNRKGEKIIKNIGEIREEKRWVQVGLKK